VVVVVGPLAYSFGFFYGMAPFTLGVGLLLWFLPDLDLFTQTPSLGSGIKMAAELGILYLAHESAMLVYAGAGFVFSVGKGWGPRDNLARFCSLGLGAFIAFLDLYSISKITTTAEQGRGFAYDPLGLRIERIPSAIFGMHEFATTLVAAMVWVLALSLRFRGGTEALAAGVASEPRDSGVVNTLQAFVYEHRLEALAACCFALYFIFPSQLHGATFLDERFLVPSAALAGVGVGPRRRLSRPAIVVGLGFMLGILTALIPVCLLNEEALNDLRRLEPLVEPGSSVAELQLDKNGDRVFTFLAADAYLAARRGGRAMNTWANTSIAPVRLGHEFDWETSLSRITTDALFFVPGVDFRFYKYVLLHSENNPWEERTMTRLLEPEGTFVGASGRFVLVRSNLQMESPQSGNYSLGAKRPDDLLERFERSRAVVDDPGWLTSGVDTKDFSLPECIDPRLVPAVCYDWTAFKASSLCSE
jgi:hypothetical protein